MKERSLPSGDIQMWPFLTAQPRITPRLPSPFPSAEYAASPLFTPSESREATSEPIQAVKQMTLETNERQRRRAFVFCPCWHARNSTTLPVDTLPLLFLSRLSRDGERKNIVAGFLFRLAKRFCLMVRAMPSKGRPLSEPWWHTPMRKSKFLGCTWGEMGKF